MIIKGFRFGMLLQIAIGPVCLYILKTATEAGILAAGSGVIAATIADALFVTLAILGMGAILENSRVKIILKYCGTVVLVYFGLGVILGSFDINIIPSLGSISSTSAISNAFITSFILTASSPLSILFWSGVFATKISCENYGKTEIKLFGIGAVSSTLVFLGILAFIAGLMHTILTEDIIKVLNVIVGIILIGFSIKMVTSKTVQNTISVDQ